ncbi:sensor domain-containing protein [Paenibacillus endoradicis]|uniref:sensor domain-containing protein n=1 Tax=Paenibacillus endoradicis TaxID=2972487 RepID=UPI002158B0F6|nr:EAL domain-containing protein [Paenibacillus endoradicis]MCR8659954.1 EAL domain-containing protein [Paenibacillus endoradicis]
MEIATSQIQISSHIWNKNFMIAQLNASYEITGMNELFQQFIAIYGINKLDQYIENIFKPFDIRLKQKKDWAEVWKTVTEVGHWNGYLMYFQSKKLLAQVEVTISIEDKAEQGQSAFVILGQDRTNLVNDNGNSDKQLRSLIDMKNAFDAASIIAVTDASGVITYVNDMFCHISKYSRHELVGKTHRVINSKHHPKQFFADMWNTIMQGIVWRGEVENRAKDGSYYWMNTTIVPFLDDQGKPYQYVSIRSDISDRVIAETKLAKVLQHDFRRTIKNLQNCIFKLTRDLDQRIIFTLSEGRIAELLDITTEQVENIWIKEVWKEQFHHVEQYFEEAFQGESHQFEMQYGNKYYYISLSPVIEQEIVIEVVGSMIDITERKEAEETIHVMAHFDSLTNLPNRTSFNRALTDVIHIAQEKGSKVAVLFMDLDRFKTVNDTMGHSAGDKLLQSVALRLLGKLTGVGYVSRQGGDEFTMYLENANRAQVEWLAEQIIEDMADPFIVNGTEVYISPSIGISMYPQDGSTIDQLLRNADAAMYVAKEKGKNNYQFFTLQLHHAISTRLELERDLRRAIEKEELELWYQPKVNLSSNQLIGMEALLRWNHPSQGMIAPERFIQIAEETNLIVPIGEWVLREACSRMKNWYDQGIIDINVAVNISLKQFMHDDFPALISEILLDSGLAPQYLELEITESVAQNAQYSIKVLNKIKQLGVSMSIDDFGTGYSSLSYLSQFPIDRLKIDQSFVRNLNDNNKVIIRTILDIANHMGISVIAEGVETIDQVEFLKHLNCQEAQGYYYSKPLAIIDANKFISAHKKITIS